MEPISVPFLSDGYFALAGADPGLAEALAVGDIARVFVDEAGEYDLWGRPL